jgi:hypothetical protein
LALDCSQRWGALSAVIMACGGASASGGSSSSDSDDYTGSLTVQNGTGQAICGLEVIQNDGFVAHSEQIDAGGTVSVNVDSPASQVFATACDGSGFAFQGNVSSSESTISLGGGNEQSFQARQDYLFQQIRMSTTMPAQDSSLMAQFQSAIEIKARDTGWIDAPTILLIASDWGIVRNRLTSIPTGRRIAALVGHRFNDGHCSLQVHTFAQTHDGNDFSGRIGYEGSSGNIYTGCTMVDALEGGGGGASSASSAGSSGGSSGGGCTNTCSSSGDGECDDGGPSSLYAVCGLGTDCDDCGAR